ncbi:hypothetical protein CAT7_09620 [Carnobacterium sp. AT7]|nr:hypothetical protein CAT7_09620 [Carnobacterium sp. AT7]
MPFSVIEWNFLEWQDKPEAMMTAVEKANME